MRILIRIQVRLGLHLDPDLRVKKYKKLFFKKDLKNILQLSENRRKPQMFFEYSGYFFNPLNPVLFRPFVPPVPGSRRPATMRIHADTTIKTSPGLVLPDLVDDGAMAGEEELGPSPPDGLLISQIVRHCN